MADINSTEYLGYTLYSNKLKNLPWSQKTVICTINQYSYCIAEEDRDFKNALKESNILLPDGIGMVWAAKLINGKKIKKIAGADIHEFLLKKLNDESGSCFYLGASEKTLFKIKERINSEYPKIVFGSFSPPFKALFSSEDTDIMIHKVNRFKPDVLFVGMTAPKQEKWSIENKHKLEAKVICSIGAVFDFYAGTVKRPSKVWIDFGLEWLGRFLKEPRRMWKRYIYYGVIFGLYLIKEKFSSYKSKT